MDAQLLSQARQLSVTEQLELMDALWADITSRHAAPGPNEAQMAELERRLSEHELNPDDAVPWLEVKAAALSQIRQ
ncbi:MAG: addiction module component [Comamonadaceae bacterium BICA1-1]|nr:MAG: addiction module component [Comamonadaceae bacterium BICA1-1]